LSFGVYGGVWLRFVEKTVEELDEALTSKLRATAKYAREVIIAVARLKCGDSCSAPIANGLPEPSMRQLYAALSHR
jgi:hypothetical protein